MSKEFPPPPPKGNGESSPEKKNSKWIAEFSEQERSMLVKVAKNISANQSAESFTENERALLRRAISANVRGDMLREAFIVQKPATNGRTRKEIMEETGRMINEKIPATLAAFDKIDRAASRRPPTPAAAAPISPEAPFMSVRETVYLPENVADGCDAFATAINTEVAALTGGTEGKTGREKNQEEIDRAVHALFQKLRADMAGWRGEYAQSAEVLEESAKTAVDAIEAFGYFRGPEEGGEQPLLYPLSDNTAWLLLRDAARSMAELYTSTSSSAPRIAEIGEQAMPTENLVGFVKKVVEARRDDTLQEYLSGIEPILHLFSPDQRRLLDYLRNDKRVDIARLHGIRYLTRGQIENIFLRVANEESFDAIAAEPGFDIAREEDGLIRESKELKNRSGEYRELAEEIESLPARADIILMLDRIDALARRPASETLASDVGEITLGETLERMAKQFGETLAAQWVQRNELPQGWKDEAATRCAAFLRQGAARLIMEPKGLKEFLIAEVRRTEEQGEREVLGGEEAPTRERKGNESILLEELSAEAQAKPEWEVVEEEKFSPIPLVGPTPLAGIKAEELEGLLAHISPETQEFSAFKKEMGKIETASIGSGNLVAQIEFPAQEASSNLDMRITISRQGERTQNGAIVFKEKILFAPEDIPLDLVGDALEKYVLAFRANISELVTIAEKSRSLLEKGVGGFDLPNNELPLLVGAGMEKGEEDASSIKSLLLHPPSLEDAQVAIKELNLALKNPYPALATEIVRNTLGVQLALAGKKVEEPARRKELAKFAILYNGFLRIAVNPQIKALQIKTPKEAAQAPAAAT